MKSIHSIHVDIAVPTGQTRFVYLDKQRAYLWDEYDQLLDEELVVYIEFINPSFTLLVLAANE